MNNKQEILGQYFTKEEIVENLLNLLFSYKKYSHSTKILEPSFGTGNFINVLKNKKYTNITGYEIDEDLTDTPADFFNVSTDKKFDLIIGNPPFSKYNLKESYYDLNKYINSEVNPSSYLTSKKIENNKDRIENIFILKTLKHLKDKNSSIGFVLPISFFIKNRNTTIKKEALKYFSSVIIYQNDKVWFDRNIPCCFVIFSNIDSLNNKILTIFENNIKNEKIFDIQDINNELIPQVIFHKNNGEINVSGNLSLEEIFDKKRVLVKKSFKDNNISAKNILEKNKIPDEKDVQDYKIAVVRVGNSSVGKCGLINSSEDITNDMFYIFDVIDEYKNSKKIKEEICLEINKKSDYFKKITCRVGSKSIKKEDVLNLKINLTEV